MAEAPPEHPAKLGVLGRTWEMVKHVGGKVLKWGAVGGLIGGAIGVPLTLGFAALTAPLSLVTGGLTSLLGGGLGGGVLAGLATIGSPLLISVLAVGGIAATLGLVTSLFGIGDAVDAADERVMADYDRRLVTQRRNQALEQGRRQEEVAMEGGGSESLRPNVPMRPGRGQNPRMST